MPKIKNPAFDGMVPITPPAPQTGSIDKRKTKTNGTDRNRFTILDN